MRKFLSYVFITGLIGFTVSARGYFDSVERAKFHGFDDEGCFVEGPIYAGASIGYVFGILPAAIITEPQRIWNYNQASDRLGTSILSGSAKSFSIFFGAFPYLLKKGFWDFPKWVAVGSSKSSEYELKPAPNLEVKIDPRLLQEEKHADLNMQESLVKPSLIELPEAHRKIQSEPAPELGTIKEVKPVSEQPAPDTQKIVLPLIPTPTVTDTAVSNISDRDSVDTGKVEDNSQKWESSGLPDWVKKQVSQ